MPSNSATSRLAAALSAPATANHQQMRWAERARNAFDRPQTNDLAGALRFAAGITALIPIAGDILGLANDVNQMRQNPEQRTPLNIGMAALGALPFIPAAMSKAKPAGSASAIRQQGNRWIDDARGAFVEEVKKPSGAVGYRAGKIVEESGHRFDSYLGDDWMVAPFKTPGEAWAAFGSLEKAAAKASASAKYQQVPKHWKGAERVAAKTLVDEYGPESVRFISSARSESKYIQTPAGKVRISGHSLPGHYDDAALDLNTSMDRKALVEALRRFANPTE